MYSLQKKEKKENNRLKQYEIYKKYKEERRLLVPSFLFSYVFNLWIVQTSRKSV